jgi:hypothetical protein
MVLRIPDDCYFNLSVVTVGFAAPKKHPSLESGIEYSVWPFASPRMHGLKSLRIFSSQVSQKLNRNLRLNRNLSPSSIDLCH